MQHLIQLTTRRREICQPPPENDPEPTQPITTIDIDDASLRAERQRRQRRNSKIKEVAGGKESKTALRGGGGVEEEPLCTTT